MATSFNRGKIRSSGVVRYPSITRHYNENEQSASRKKMNRQYRDPIMDTKHLLLAVA